jgi:hypothetical protein
MREVQFKKASNCESDKCYIRLQASAHSAALLTGNHLKSKSPMPILFLRMSLGYITKVLYNSTRDDYDHS